MTLEDIILRFLKLSYPVLKIKQGARFKRCIIIHDRKLFLSDKESFKVLLKTLFDLLNSIYLCDEQICLNVLKKYLA